MKTMAILFRVAFCFLLSLIPVGHLEDPIYATRLELRGRTTLPSQLLIIEISPNDFQTLKRISASAPQTTEAIRGEDLRDSYLWNPGTFAWLSNRLFEKGAERIVLTWDIPEKVKHSLPDPTTLALNQNKKILWSTDDLGYRLVKDPDSTVRRLQEAVPGGRTFLVNFAGPEHTLTHCTIADVLKDARSSSCSDLQGKTLLLAKENDHVRTPLGLMSQAETVGNVIRTMNDIKPIRTASWLAQASLIFAMIWLTVFYVLYYPVLVSFIAMCGTGFAVIVVSLQILFEMTDCYFPSINVTVSMLLTYLVFTGYRLAFQEDLHWRWLKQTQYLRELDKMKTNFLSLLSHDLKTPLAKIQAVGERLRRELELPPEQRSDWSKLLDSIENSNNELKHYIVSILNLSKIESQKVILNKKSNDINSIIQHALRRLRRLSKARGITFEEQLEPLFSVECDEELMLQVLTNLVDNAIKYSPENSRVIVRSREEGSFIRVEVEDFGPGIPKDKLPLMFRKFSRFYRPIDEKVKGTGLGLYLSKYFIELHGGTIQVRSEEGKGTTFSFTLPMHQASSPS